jgi:Ala-tRNA(Pro) deacylase
MSAESKVRAYLDAEGVDYEMIHHKRDYRATATATHTHTPTVEFAKTVFVWVDGKPAMAVVPASKQLAPSKLRKGLNAEEVRIAKEYETRELCSDSEVGAAPPFGNLYDLPVYVSVAISHDEEITFNGGDHEHAFRMRYEDFERLVHPVVMPLTKHDE